MLFVDIVLKLGAVANSISISIAEAALGLLVLYAAYKTFKIKDFSFAKKSFFIFYILMIIVETISTFTGVDPQNSMKDYFSGWVLLYLPVLYIVFEGKDRVTYLMYVYGGSLIASVYGIIEAPSRPFGRADGFFSHALTYGNVCAIVCISAFGVILYRIYDKKWQLYLTSASLLVTLTALFMSGSRGPILSLFIALFLMLVYRFRVKGLIAGVILVAVMLFVVFQVPAVNERLKNTVTNMTKTDSSIGTRLVLWEASSKCIMMRPLFGYGKRNFKSEVSKYINVKTSSRAHAHNSYIQYTFLHGFVGLFVMLGFIGSILYEIARRMRHNDLLKVSMFVMIVFLLEGLTENNFSDSEVVMMCLYLVGLAIAPGRPHITHKTTSVETE